MEKVDYMMEQMLPELQDLQEKKLFTPDEIREIVKRRTQFERALIRRVARKEDFLRYAAYELNMDALRKMRLKRRKNGDTKPSISSFSIQRRALNIFDRATKKFKGDVGLWIQYSEVAKAQKAKKLIGRVLTDALLHHPTSPTLYILLSNHQLNDLLSPLSSRALLQRGLRLLPNCLELWTEYAKMELIFIERLRRRWAVLGVTGGEDEGMESEEGRQVIMSGGIWKLVWEGAKKALESSEDVHWAFISLVREFPTPLRSELLEEVLYPSLRTSLADKASTWSVLAQKALVDRPYPTPEGVEEDVPVEGRELVDGLKVLVGTFKEGLAGLEGKERDKGAEEWARLLEQWMAKTEEGPLRQYLQLHFNTLLSPPATTPTIQSNHLASLLLSSTPSSKDTLRFAAQATSLFPASPVVWAGRLRAALQFDKDVPEVVRSTVKVGLSVYPEEEPDRTGWIELWTQVGLYLSTLEPKQRAQESHSILSRSLSTPLSTSNARSTVSSLPVHSHLLTVFLPLLHPPTETPTADERQATFRSIERRYLPTVAFYEFAFAHERALDDPSSKEILAGLFAQWRALASRAGGAETNAQLVEREASLVECYLAWLAYLREVGDGKGVREVMRSLGKGELGEKVEEGWRIRLEEIERDEADESDSEEEEDDDVEMTVE